MITVPMTVNTTDNEIPMSVNENEQGASFDIDHVVAPVQIDFTTDTETLPAGSQAEVTYSQKNFHFAIPQGAQGIQGEQGPQGIQGVQGIQGIQGIQGEQGETGSPGRDGTDGKDGKDGNDGVSPAVTISIITGGHSVTITDADHPSGQSFDVMDGANGTNGTNGAPGVTFTPSVSSAGVISWTNDGSQTNPESVDITAAVLAALPTWNGGSY